MKAVKFSVGFWYFLLTTASGSVAFSPGFRSEAICTRNAQYAASTLAPSGGTASACIDSNVHIHAD